LRNQRPSAGAGRCAVRLFALASLQLRAMSTIKRILLWLMAAFYIFGGLMHFARPDYYMPMMPPYLPSHSALIFLSGLAELVLGIAVLIPTLRPLAAWGIIALLIAIFPANVHIALHNVPVFGAAEGAGIWNWVRLPLQLVLILWAWWYTQPESPSRA
jgi:uncharacterized membrane protein